MRGDFVIQVRAEGGLNRERLHGRIEHMDSGRSARFQSVEELVGFILGTVQRDADVSTDTLPSRRLPSQDLTES